MLKGARPSSQPPVYAGFPCAPKLSCRNWMWGLLYFCLNVPCSVLRAATVTSLEAPRSAKETSFVADSPGKTALCGYTSCFLRQGKPVLKTANLGPAKHLIHRTQAVWEGGVPEAQQMVNCRHTTKRLLTWNFPQFVLVLEESDVVLNFV